jgi:hypothetical protein
MIEETIGLSGVQLADDEQMYIQGDNLVSIRPSGMHVIPLSELPTFIIALQEVVKWRERDRDPEAQRKTHKLFTIPVSSLSEAEMYMSVLQMFKLVPQDCVLAGVKPRAGVDAIYVSPVPNQLMNGKAQ